MLLTLGRGMAPKSSSAISYTAPTYDYYVILLAGQSNMAGYGTPITAGNGQPDEPDDRILMLKRAGDATDQTLVQAEDPLDHWDDVGVGMGLTYAKQLLATIPATSRIILVPTAQGSTGFESGWEEDGVLFDDLILRANEAVSLAQGLGNVKVHSFLWHQAEANSGMTKSLYGQYLYNLISRVRNEVSLASSVPFICGDVTEVTISYPAREILSEIASNVPYAGFAPSTGIEVDSGFNQHFTAAGYRAFALIYWAQYQNGLSADLSISAPDPLNDLTATVGNAEIQLDWTAPNSNGSNIVNYIIEYKLSSEPTIWTELYDGIGAAITKTVTGLTNDSSYDFRVKAVNAAGISNLSNTATETPTSSDFNFAAYTNLFVYNVTDPANYVASGGEVSQVNDIGGNGRHAVEISSGVNPQEGSFGGVNGVEFLAGDHLQMPDASLENSAITIFTAYVTPSVDNFQFIVASQGGDNVWSMNQAARMGGGSNINTSPAKAINTPIVQAAYVTGTGSGTTQYIKVNDNAVASNTTDFNNNPSNIHLATWNGGGFNFTGTLFFAACYVGLSDADRNAIGSALATKINGAWTNI